MIFFTRFKNVTQNPKPFLESYFLTDFENGIKTILHNQMTEKIAFKVRPKKADSWFIYTLWLDLAGDLATGNSWSIYTGYCGYGSKSHIISFMCDSLLLDNYCYCSCSGFILVVGCQICFKGFRLNC